MIRVFRALSLLLLSAIPASATIDYTVSLARQQEHLFRVTMKVTGAGDALTVQMPAWNALYQIRDFAQRVQELKVRAEGNAPLRLTKLDKQTWIVRRVDPAAAPLGTVTLHYDVFWDEAGPFAAQLNNTHAFVNFAMVLFYVPDRRGEDVRVQMRDMPEGWKLAVALPRGETPYTFRARNYDALVDAPAEASDFQEESFPANGAKIRLVVHGTAWNRTALREAIERIVAYQVELMGGAPFEEFIFIYHFGLGGSGGMEHANSTAIALGANAGGTSVTAHEFFHLWNVKRIRPRTLEPVDFTRENWTRALWFAEGVTSTYGSFTLVRTGLWSREQFYEHVASEIAALESRPARRWQSAEQASLDAWLERYRTYSRPEASISYYNKGQILGFLLDILVRDATENRRSLDDVLRTLNQEFGRKGRYYNDSEDIRAVVEKVAGRDFGDFFMRYVAGTDELPCAEVLRLAGLDLASRDSSGSNGGKPSYTLRELSDASPRQRSIREGLLRGAAEALAETGAEARREARPKE